MNAYTQIIFGGSLWLLKLTDWPDLSPLDQVHLQMCPSPNWVITQSDLLCVSFFVSKRTSIEYSQDEDYACVEVWFYIPDIQTSVEPQSDCYCPHLQKSRVGLLCTWSPVLWTGFNHAAGILVWTHDDLLMPMWVSFAHNNAHTSVSQIINSLSTQNSISLAFSFFCTLYKHSLQVIFSTRTFWLYLCGAHYIYVSKSLPSWFIACYACWKWATQSYITHPMHCNEVHATHNSDNSRVNYI